MECKNYYNVGVRCPYCGSLINEETNTKGPVLTPDDLNKLKENLLYDGKTVKEKKEEKEAYQRNKLNE
jgi:sarcosine oxidase delta subunit